MNRMTIKLSEMLTCLKRDKWLYVMLIPMIACIIAFNYMPASGLQIAFKDFSLFKGIEKSPWCGWENFRDLFAHPNFLRALRNTFRLGLTNLLIGFPFPIIIALLLKEVKNKYFGKLAQTVMVFPYFISAVVVAGLITTILSPSTGIVNVLIRKLGGEAVYFLSKPQYFTGIYVIMNIWKNAGFQSILYTAALTGISEDLYEAAKLDGAGRWAQFRYVTWPGIMPTVITLLIINVGQIINVGYETILLLYQPATYEAADVISTMVYREGLLNANYGLATAAGLFNTVVALIMVVGANKISSKLSETSLW